MPAPHTDAAVSKSAELVEWPSFDSIEVNHSTKWYDCDILVRNLSLIIKHSDSDHQQKTKKPKKSKGPSPQLKEYLRKPEGHEMAALGMRRDKKRISDFLESWNKTRGSESS